MKDLPYRELKEQNQELQKEIQELRTQKERYQKLIETSDAIFWMVSPDWKKLFYISPSFENIFDISCLALYNNPALWIKSIHPDDKLAIIKKFKKLHGTTFRSEYRIINQSGEVRWLKSSTSPVYNGSELVMLTGLIQDITESKRLETQSIISKERFLQMAASIQDGLAIIEENRVVFINKRFTEITGLNLHDLRTKSLFDFAITCEKERISEFQEKYAQTGKQFQEIEAWFKTNHDELKYLVCKLSHYQTQKHVHYLVIADITEKQKQKEELQKREIGYRNLINNLPEAVWTFNISKETYYISSAIKKITGFPAENFMNDTYFGYRLIHPDSLSIVQKAWNNLYHHNQLFSIEYQTKNNLNQYIWIEETAFRLYEEDGERLVEGLIKDITEKKQSALIQNILFNIANAANISKESRDFYQIIQNELNKLFDTTNFFIALYEKETDSFTLPFMQDEKDSFEHYPAGKTLISCVVKKNASLLLKEKDMDKMQESGEIEAIGTPCKVWLGVPLKINDEIIGVLGVQSYVNEDEYDHDDMAILQFVSQQVSISIHKKKVEESIQISEKKNSAILQAIPDLMFEISRDGRFISYKGMRSNLLTDPEYFLGKQLHEILPPVLAKLTKEAVDYVLANNKMKIYEYELPVQNELGFFEARMVTSSEDTVLSIVRNITERKNAEEKIRQSLSEKEILLKEIHHRVKNNLQLITSMFRLQMDYINDEHTLSLYRESLNRLKSMALIHEKLYHQTDFSRIDFRDYLVGLTKHLYASFGTPENRFRTNFQVESIFIDVNRAIPLGLIVNELLTNVVKYAFPNDCDDNLVEIIFKKVKEELHLTVRDNGVGLPVTFNPLECNSLGYQLVMGLVEQISGKLKLSRISGTEVSIIFLD
jgi:PAS domain S-box-containing protein